MIEHAKQKRPSPAERRAAEKAELARWDATVLSNDAQESVCRGCRQKRVLFQTHDFAANTVIARCKDCLTKQFGERIYVSENRRELRDVWRKNARKPASPASQNALAVYRSRKRAEREVGALELAERQSEGL